MKARAALGSRAGRLGLGAYLSIGAALPACGRVELGSYATHEGAGASNGSAGSDGVSVLEREAAGAPDVLGGVVAAAEPASASDPPANVYAAPTRGPSADEDEMVPVEGVDSSSVVTLGAGDAGAGDAGASEAGDAAVVDAAPPRGPSAEIAERSLSSLPRSPSTRVGMRVRVIRPLSSKHAAQ